VDCDDEDDEEENFLTGGLVDDPPPQVTPLWVSFKYHQRPVVNVCCPARFILLYFGLQTTNVSLCGWEYNIPGENIWRERWAKLVLERNEEYLAGEKEGDSIYRRAKRRDWDKELRIINHVGSLEPPKKKQKNELSPLSLSLLWTPIMFQFLVVVR